ncbi:hypothetical protein [Actinomyces faecalis]|uniref:hypothetical protein n=1 Tax=Actinomyces faecalis TaxID=2722820 RepID=UPI001552BDE1|nr:hypothetical protein [Actinomyces faecalis]
MTRLSRPVAVLGAALLTAVFAAPAAAQTTVDTYPETPLTNAVLPIVHTYHRSDHIKPNILNPRPVCNSAEDYRTTVYKAARSFTPAGTVSTTNDTAATIPLTQNTSKTHSVTLTVSGDLTHSSSINLGSGGSQTQDGQAMNVSAGITSTLTKRLGASMSASLSWSAGQQIGPYDVPAGHTGEATYGFETLSLTGTQQYCRPNGTWSTPTAWRAFTPIRNEVKVKLYDNATGASSSLGSSTSSNMPIYTQIPVDEAQPVDGVAEGDFDLRPSFTVSALKAKGYAGSVALRVTNDGAKSYEATPEHPVRLKVEVKTAEGPEGVDRLITTSNFNGAYVRDLGFDRGSSTRTFEVTLSNPVEPGETTLVSAFSFGDGLTKLGRVVNYMEVTQTGRVAGDVSTANDFQQDSRKVTLTDGGRSNPGLF